MILLSVGTDDACVARQVRGHKNINVSKIKKAKHYFLNYVQSNNYVVLGPPGTSVPTGVIFWVA